MSSNKTPISSPRMPKSVKLDVPSTPPAAKNRKSMSQFITTPDQNLDVLPYSPGLKRTNSGSFRSPDYRLNTADTVSPYSASNLLKTPKNGGYDSDERDTPRRTKLSKTPQYLNVGERLFAEDGSPTKKELGEISSQLKNKLSSAFGALQQKEKTSFSPTKLDFGDVSHTSTKESPTKLLGSQARSPRGRTNINLQTLEQSPVITSVSPRRSRLSTDFSDQEPKFSIPSPDEESSAHNALLAAFSRVKERRKSQGADSRYKSQSLRDPFHPSPRSSMASGSLKLPPINVQPSNGSSEQEAIYSLMSLSSPQSKKNPMSGGPHPGHALPTSASTSSSRSSSVAMPVLPPISGLIRKVDDDETDIEDSTDDD